MVPHGGSASYSVSVYPTRGLTDLHTLPARRSSDLANGSFTPNPATASSTLSVTTSPTTPTGTYTLTLTGASGSLTRTTRIAVLTTALPDRTQSASPLSQTVPQGRSTSYSVTISPTG